MFRSLSLCIRLLSFIFVLFALPLLLGFDFSNPKKLRQDIRKEIRAELEKIIEKTPSGKLRNTWWEKRRVAEKSLNAALMLDAPTYCPKSWDEAVALFKKAKKYASKREYRKAIYLAKKTKEFADKATSCANKYIKKQNSELKKEYQKLRNRMDEAMGLIPPDAEDLIRQASELSLKVEEISYATRLRQFDRAKSLCKTLQKQITDLEKAVKAYREEHEPQEDI